MSDIAIRVENLGKLYRIGERESYKALRDVIADSAATPFRMLRSAFNGNGASSNSNGRPSSVAGPSPSATIWALDDVSFEVKQGEVVGIIGRNGAGKSTLLKILSRITKPTKGHAKIYGRVGSLLEVGTGFHPELTGRENIYLNGAILGMRKAEIERKFDEIVAFAEVEKFIDTPVKRYSSGMYVRLAFAVAAHMETEVLLVDEVLAVGDAEFQKKCLGKMGDVAQKGRTVLFVSHNMAATQSICNHAFLINGGRLINEGRPRDVIEYYLRSDDSLKTSSSNLEAHPNRHRGCHPIFQRIRIKNGQREEVTSVSVGEDLLIEFFLKPQAPINRPTLGIGIDDDLGVRIFSVTTYYSQLDWDCLDKPVTITCRIPNLNLVPGRYHLNISIGNLHEQHMDAISNACSFYVESADYFGTGRIPPRDLGMVFTRSDWTFSES